MFIVTWICIIQVKAKKKIISSSLNPTLFDTISNPVVFVVGFTGSYVPEIAMCLTKNGTHIETGIDTWINKQCKQWRGTTNKDHKCFILTEYGQYIYSELQFTTSIEQLIIKIKNRKRHTITRSSQAYILLKALQTKAPSTPSPVISGTCEERKNPLDCTGHCRYFGVEYKCRAIDYCGFSIHSACKSNPKYCRFNPHINKCTWK